MNYSLESVTKNHKSVLHEACPRSKMLFALFALVMTFHVERGRTYCVFLSCFVQCMYRLFSSLEEVTLVLELPGTHNGAS